MWHSIEQLLGGRRAAACFVVLALTVHLPHRGHGQGAELWRRQQRIPHRERPLLRRGHARGSRRHARARVHAWAEARVAGAALPRAAVVLVNSEWASSARAATHQERIDWVFRPWSQRPFLSTYSSPTLPSPMVAVFPWRCSSSPGGGRSWWPSRRCNAPPRRSPPLLVSARPPLVTAHLGMVLRPPPPPRWRVRACSTLAATVSGELGGANSTGTGAARSRASSARGRERSYGHPWLLHAAAHALHREEKDSRPKVVR